MADSDFPADDHRALAALVRHGGALCTIVGIDGSFSRRRGAQLAVHGDRSTSGDLADSCLEAAMVEEARAAATAGMRRLVRYGKGSSRIDFRLPCGGGLDILIDPQPDLALCAAAFARLEARQPARLLLPLADGDGSFVRDYIPALRLIVAGAGPEPAHLAQLAAAMGIAATRLLPIGHGGQGTLSLGQPPQGVAVDPWTAIVLLFHDHEWEEALLRWAIATPALLIGAQGGAKAREQRNRVLEQIGGSATARAQVRGPIGLIPHTRDPKVLALSVLAECVASYEQLLPG